MMLQKQQGDHITSKLMRAEDLKIEIFIFSHIAKKYAKI